MIFTLWQRWHLTFENIYCISGISRTAGPNVGLYVLINIFSKYEQTFCKFLKFLKFSGRKWRCHLHRTVVCRESFIRSDEDEAKSKLAIIGTTFGYCKTQVQAMNMFHVFFWPSTAYSTRHKKMDKNASPSRTRMSPSKTVGQTFHGQPICLAKFARHFDLYWCYLVREA